MNMTIDRKFNLDVPADKEVECPCGVCNAEVAHTVHAVIEERTAVCCEYGCDNFYTAHQLVQCCGCKTVSLRVLSDSDIDRPNSSPVISYFPGRVVGLNKVELQYLPAQLLQIFKETLEALGNGQLVLAGVGVRAIIETMCKDRQAQGGDLHKKINWLHGQGFVTQDGLKILHQLRILGNAAAHEVTAHSEEKLKTAMAVVIHMIEMIYVIPVKCQQHL